MRSFGRTGHLDEVLNMNHAMTNDEERNADKPVGNVNKERIET
jgi:hypothetical protein